MQIAVDVLFPYAIGLMFGFPIKVEVDLFLLTSIGLCDPSSEFMLLFDIYFSIVKLVLYHLVNSINCQ